MLKRKYRRVTAAVCAAAMTIMQLGIVPTAARGTKPAALTVTAAETTAPAETTEPAAETTVPEVEETSSTTKSTKATKATTTTTTAEETTSTAKSTKATTTTTAEETTSTAKSTKATKATTTTAAEETTSTAKSTKATKVTTTTTTAEETTSATKSTKATKATTTTEETTVTELTTAPTETTTEAPTEPETPAETDPEGMPDFSYLGAVGTLTEEQTVMVAKCVWKVLSGFESGADYDYDTNQVECITVSAENKQSIQNIYDTIRYQYRIGILTTGFYTNTIMPAHAGLPAQYVGISNVSYLFPDKMMCEEQYEVACAKLDAIEALVKPEWSAPEIALFYHDYMAVNYDYDKYSYYHNAPSGDLCYTAYGLLTGSQRTAVCQGYAWLYNLLLNEAGMESYIVSSRMLENPDEVLSVFLDPFLVDEEGEPVDSFVEGNSIAQYWNHAWNIVRIDGEFYHVDVTFDDNVQTSNSQIGLAGQVSHASFLKPSGAMISSGHKHKDAGEYGHTLESYDDDGEVIYLDDQLNIAEQDWKLTTGVLAYDLAKSNHFSNAFWTTTSGQGSAAIYPFEEGWLVKEMRGNTACFNLYTYDYASNSYDLLREVATCQGQWGSYSDNYSVFCVQDDILYYTTNNGVMAVIHKQGGNEYEYVFKWLFGLDGTESAHGDLYGLRIADGKLIYQITTDPHINPYTTSRYLSAFLDDIYAAASFVAGDISGDGTLDVTDVIKMNKLLSGEDALSTEAPFRKQEFKRVDLVEDGVLDIFDLAMLKWMLLHQS